MAVWIGLPRLVQSRISSRIDGLSARVDGRVAHGEVSLHDGWVVSVASLDWTAGDDWRLEARDIDLTVDPMSVLFGSPRLEDVRIGGLSVRLGSPAEPFEGPRAALERARGLLQTPGKGGGRNTPIGRAAKGALPTLEIDEVSAEVAVKGPWAFEVTSGRIEVGPPEGSLDATLAGLRCRFGFAFRDGVKRALTVDGLLDPTAGPRKLSAHVRPYAEYHKEWGSARLSGLAWKPGELRLLSPGWKLGRRFALEASEIAFRWEEVDGESEPAGEKAHERAVLALPEQIRPLMKGRRIVEVEFSRPVVDVELPGGAPSASPVTPRVARGVRTGGKEGAFRHDVERLARSMDAGIGLVRRGISRLADRLPPGRVVVHGATVRYLSKGEPVPGAGPSLANLDGTVSRSRKTGRVEGRVSFECPEAASGSNEFVFDVDPVSGDGRLHMKAGRLPLYPYRGLAPTWFLVDAGTVVEAGDLEVTMEGAQEKLDIEGGLRVVDTGLFIPGLASNPLHGIDMAVSGRFRMDVGAGTIALEDGVAEVGSIRIPLSFAVTSMTRAPRVKLDARIERLKAQDLIDSFPNEMIPALDGVRLSGSFAATLEMDLDTRDMTRLKFDFKPEVADLKVIDPGSGANLELLQHQFLHRIEESGGRVVKRFIGPSSPSWVPLDEVPRYLVSALTTSEDSQFFKHHGFSLGGIRRSLRVNLERGGFYQGASTLSQQLVKNLFLSSEKTLARKLQEAFITWQLERFLSKDRILELYLNVVEWGPDSHGLREAAMHYFGKSPKELSLLEAAYLVCIIPNPRGYHAHYEKGSVPRSFMRRVRRLLREMHVRGMLSQEALDDSALRSIRFALAPLSDDAAPPEETIPDDEFSDD